MGNEDFECVREEDFVLDDQMLFGKWKPKSWTQSFIFQAKILCVIIKYCFYGTNPQSVLALNLFLENLTKSHILLLEY